MRYADSCCTYVEDYTSEDHAYVFTGPCVVTNKEHSVRVPASGLYQYRQGAKIQDAFPDMPVGDREFLMSGISPDAFDNLFSECEEE